MLPGRKSENESEAEAGGRGLWPWVFAGLGLIVTAFLLWLSPVLLGLIMGTHQIKRSEAKMRGAAVYQSTAQTLALYCQSDPALFPQDLSSAWLPSALARLGPSYTRVRTNSAIVEMGGGFYRFGYQLHLDQQHSSPLTNVWQLSLYREGLHVPETLTTVALAKTQHFEANDLLNTAAAGYDFSIKKGNLDAYQGKVMLLMRFHKTADAARVCNEWLKRQQQSWRPHFIYAHLRCRLGETEAAATEFSQWVGAHPNFAHCVYLSLFQFREARTNDALAGVRLALQQPFIEPSGTDGNKFYLGQNAALIAFLAADYDLCLAMCDKMLADSRKERAWLRETLRIKAAATSVKKDKTAATALIQQAIASREKQTFGEDAENKTDQILLRAIEADELETVRNLGMWADEFAKWFGPFETDETGMHGPTDIPTPYPASWKSDLMSTRKEDQ